MRHLVISAIAVVSIVAAWNTNSLATHSQARVYPTIEETNGPHMVVRQLSSYHASAREDVWLAGLGFDSVTGVEFNGIPAKFQAYRDRLIVTRPPVTARSGPLVIGNRSHSVTVIPHFIVDPAIDRIFPLKGTTGTKVTVDGVGLNRVDRLLFGETPATFEKLTDTRLVTWLPHFLTSGTITIGAGDGNTTVQFDLALDEECSNASRLIILLNCNGISTSEAPKRHLDLVITSFAYLNDARWFAAGYYLDNGKGYLDGHLLFLVLDKQTGRWSERDLYSDMHGENGSLLSIRRIGDFWYATLHHTPSATTTLQINNDLRVQNSYYGWMEATFAGGPIVFQNSMIHFAPTHPTRLSLFYPSTGAVTTIFPKKPYGPTELAHNQRIGAILAQHDQQWPEQHHMSYDPNESERELRGELVVNSATHALAFIISYDEPDRQTSRDRFIESAFSNTWAALESPRPWEPIASNLASDIDSITDSHREQIVQSIFSHDTDLLQHLALDREPFSYTVDTRYFFYGENSFDVDLYWQSRLVQQRLRAALRYAVPYVAAVYIYRNVDDPADIQCKELPIPYGAAIPDSSTLARYLEKDELQRIFH